MSKEVLMDLRTVWLVVCLLGLLLCLSSEARAEIIYGDGPSNVVQNYFLVRSLDLNKDGQFDFHLEEYAIGTTDIPPSSVTRFLGLRGTADGSTHNNGVFTGEGRALPLPLGSLIGPSADEPFSWTDGFRQLGLSHKRSGETMWQGPWEDQKTGFLAVRFLADDQYHYGWIRLNVEDIPLSSMGDVYALIPPHIVDFAYESTPNTPIAAGAVPEPGTWLLVLVSVAIVAGWKLRWRMLPFLICVLVPIGANGEIVYRMNSDLDERLIDLDSDGTTDFRFRSNLLLFPPISWRTDVEGFSSSGILVRDDQAIPIARDSIIGPQPHGDSEWRERFMDQGLSALHQTEGWSGVWHGVERGLIGISFQSDAGLHYGWIQLSLDHELVPTEGIPGVVGRIRFGPVVHDWAYESIPNTPIAAGAVPEPESVAFVLVGTIAVISWRWRKGRQSATSLGG